MLVEKVQEGVLRKSVSVEMVRVELDRKGWVREPKGEESTFSYTAKLDSTRKRRGGKWAPCICSRSAPL